MNNPGNLGGGEWAFGLEFVPTTLPLLNGALNLPEVTVNFETGIFLSEVFGGSITVLRGGAGSVVAGDGIEGDFTLLPYADRVRSNLDVVGGNVEHLDAWSGEHRYGTVLGEVTIADSAFFDLTVDVAFGGVNIVDSLAFDTTIGFAPTFVGEGLRDADIAIDYTFDLRVEGEELNVNVEHLDGFAQVRGEDISLSIGAGDGFVLFTAPDGNLELEDFFGTVITDADVAVEIKNSEVQVDIGPDGTLFTQESFVFGNVGEGSEVVLDESAAILTLAGSNSVFQSGGQSIFDAKNGAVDQFRFTDGALVDGWFDPFDLLDLDSGAQWTFAQLTTALGSTFELLDDVVISAEVVGDDLFKG